MENGGTVLLNKDGAVTEVWRPTLSLRWSKDGVLEQAWQDLYCRIKWIPVPREAE